MRILYGILNFNRPLEWIDRLYNQLPADTENSTRVVVTNRKKDLNQRYKWILGIQNDDSVAFAKNKILRFARDEKYDYCFIIEDDVIVNDNSIFTKYVNLMKMFDLPFTMYGFDRMNLVLNNKPNACLEVKIGDKTVIASRHICSSVLGFAINKDLIFFDERLKLLETEFLMKDMQDKKLYPYYGFFMDVAESWKYFSREVNAITMRKKTPELAKADSLIRPNDKIVLENKADPFLDFIKDKCLAKKEDLTWLL